MKFKTTALLATATLALGLSVYFFDIKKETNDLKKKEIVTQILNFDKDQINLIEIQKNEIKYILQKSQTGWAILEPIQDAADNDQVENMLELLTAEKYLAIAKESTDPKDLKLIEFGLDKPYASFNFKNNLGQSKKVELGTQKNFEGNSFLRIDSENRILVASALWLSKADQNLMTYREKRLYRSSLGAVEDVKIQSLQDKFELKRVNGKWINAAHPDMDLDQNKVRDTIKQIAESPILDYVIDGEPSKLNLSEKKLIYAPVHIEFVTATSHWFVSVNQSEKENAVFALTDRPTNLLKLDPSRWELLGNLNFDSFRDRTSLLKFNLSDVKKIYYKNQDREFNFIKDKDGWKSLQKNPQDSEFSATELVKILDRIHDLEITEFLDLDLKKQVHQSFTGKNMIILRSDSDNLIFQLNWGPGQKLKQKGIEKYYFLSRTNQSPIIFALEKNKLAAIAFEQVFKKKEQNKNEAK